MATLKIAKDERLKYILHLLDELRYHIDKGLEEGAINEGFGYQFYIPHSTTEGCDTVSCSFITQPVSKRGESKQK